MWIIQNIQEADFGCEERLPGEPLMALVTLESDDGRVVQFEMPDNWLIVQHLNVGDEWPEDLDSEDEDSLKAASQSAWMDQYMQALEEMDEE